MLFFINLLVVIGLCFFGLFELIALRKWFAFKLMLWKLEMTNSKSKPTLKKQQLVNLSLDDTMLAPELTPQVAGGITPTVGPVISATIRVSYRVCTKRVCGAFADGSDEEL